VNATKAPPEKGGASTPQIPGIPLTEQAASSDSASVEQAIAEEEFLSRNSAPEELKKDAERQEHHRNQRFRHHFEHIAVCTLWLAAIAIASVGAIWLWHMIAPSNLRWLTGEDVSHLQSIVTAGLLVGVIGNHFKKRLG
jgi:cation transport ATPase